MDHESRKKRLRQAGQEHLLQFVDELDASERARLFAQIDAIDFDHLRRCVESARAPTPVEAFSRLQPPDVVELPRDERGRREWSTARQRGLEALSAGRVAVVLVAGGQGSRLGFEHPKGMFPIGPVNQTSLFQIHAEKILARQQQAGHAIPWFIMTSPDNHDESREFFERHHHFGLRSEDVFWFNQGTLPAVDETTGEVLLADKGRIFTNPDGHGGTLFALRDAGHLELMAKRGIDLLYYFQVDNAFADILDPAFIGRHLEQDAEVSLKVIRKTHGTEKLGTVVQSGVRTMMIEYSDLPNDVATQEASSGQPLYWAGSIAIHVFRRSFLDRLAGEATSLPIHVARKIVPHVGRDGRRVQPERPNAMKFETFIFDTLPAAQKVCVVETDRTEEYEPIKNATGEHSPEEVRRAIVVKAGRWLDHAGIRFPRRSDGAPSIELEISPLLALDAEEFKQRIGGRTTVDRPTYFQLQGEEQATSNTR